MTQVSISHLTKSFGAAPVVDDLSLTIDHGEFVSLLGPSGCGKTTTLRMIAGFEIANSGTIAFDGVDVSPVPAEKRDIGMVFQNYALFPHMTVGQNLAFGLEMRKVAPAEIAQRTARVLDMVQLGGFAERYPAQLSGGQQQRVALARALVIEPRILLLDEPLANLDAKLREEMRGFIRDLQKRVGITTVYVTHDQAEALSMSDRVVVMFGGRIAQQGAPDAIYDRPASRQVAGFVGQVNILEGMVSGSDGGRAVVRLPQGEITVPAASVPAAGSKAAIAMRPEAVALGAAGEPGWAGTVVSRQYGGNLVDYKVELAGGSTVHVQCLSATPVAPGTAVTVRPDQSRLWLLGA
ncbi:ABC transporter ATP-binding protein [uncultured Alsobacter sp.]|uniref:ABC transporter ATP-binding protein n=1 Tax=uncultured Alsobacter sp. TaxID=1748258 RepID=UPI0025DD6027|nr:ABC transporter ATP-binding protein [uncultured Alsobacter sp.]